MWDWFLFTGIYLYVISWYVIACFCCFLLIFRVSSRASILDQSNTLYPKMKHEKPVHVPFRGTKYSEETAVFPLDERHGVSNRQQLNYLFISLFMHTQRKAQCSAVLAPFEWNSPGTTGSIHKRPGGCFTNVSLGLQNILSRFVYCRNRTAYVNFKLKLCTCAQRAHVQSFSLKFAP